LPTEPELDLVLVGRVGRPHGVDGAFVVEDASASEARFAVGATLVVDGELAEIVLSRRVGGRRRAIRLDRAVARGTALYVPRSALPDLPEGSYYVAELVGMTVVDEDGEPVGVIRDVLPGPANDVLELDTGLLLPLVEACVREIDVEARRVGLNPGFTG
jgi:16S rRNA processing protein RimM